MIDWLNKKIITRGEFIAFSFVCAAIFILIAHGFWFFNLDLSHDYLNEVYALGVMGWKITIGRFLAPLINIILGQFVVLPWLSGVVMIVMMGLITILISKIFRLERRWQIILLSGLFSTSLALTTLMASFMGDLAPNMIALFLAVLSAFEWDKLAKRFSLKTFLFCVLASFLSLGCYQGYLPVTIVLIIIKSIENLLCKDLIKKTVKNGLIGIAAIILSMGLYFGAANLAGTITGYKMVSNTTNSLSNVWSSEQSLVRRGFNAYIYTLWGLFAPTLAATPAKSNLLHLSETTWQVYLISAINLLIFVYMVFSLLFSFEKEKLETSAKVLILVLILLLPFAANAMHFLSGTSHILMHYAFVLFYLLFILLFELQGDKINSKILSKGGGWLVAAAGLIVLINISFSNLLYVKKDLEKQSTLATMTRVLSVVEERDDYEFAKTKLCFIGEPNVQTGLNDMKEVSMLFGAEYNSAVTYQATYNAYLNNLLQYKTIMCSAKESENIESSETFSRMGAFPSESAIQMIDDILVIKMGASSSL